MNKADVTCPPLGGLALQSFSLELSVMIKILYICAVQNNTVTTCHMGLLEHLQCG